jgi:DNA-binding protein H-NS
MKYYEAIRQFLANLTMGAVNYVQTIEKKELLEQLNTLKLSENMDFYMRIVLLSAEREKFSNLMKKSTTAEENLTVALYHAACKNKRIEALKRYIQKLKNN